MMRALGDKEMQWRRLVYSAILLGFLGFGVGRLYYRATDDFRLGSIMEPLPHRPQWEIALTSEEEAQLPEIFNQPYHYLGKGAQSYAFGSEDEKYVVKFFKFKHLRPSWLLNNLPGIEIVEKWRQEDRTRKQKKFESVFDGYKLAFDRHKKESGLIYLHLNPTKHLNQTLELTDKIGRTWQIPLDDILFVIQEKGQTTRQVIGDLLQKGEVEKAKERFDQIITLYLQEYSKGVYDRDHGVMHNTGFVGDKAIHLDIGKLSDEPKMRDPEVYRKDLLKVVQKMELWVRNHYPEYYSQIIPPLEARLTIIYGEPFYFEEMNAKYPLS